MLDKIKFFLARTSYHFLNFIVYVIEILDQRPDRHLFCEHADCDFKAYSNNPDDVKTLMRKHEREKHLVQ